jgi:hypothetical protein
MDASRPNLNYKKDSAAGSSSRVSISVSIGAWWSFYFHTARWRLQHSATRNSPYAVSSTYRGAGTATNMYLYQYET